MSKHYSSEMSTDENGNVSITFNAESWNRFLQLWAQTAHMGKCARDNWLAGNPHAALIFYDRMDNGPMARLHAIAPEEVHALVDPLIPDANEGK